MKHFLLSVLAATAAILPAQDDRDRQTPTGTFWAPGQTTADLTTLVNDGWRFTDLEIETTSPWRLTVAAVPNSGTYAKAWWYAIGVTAAQLTTTINTNNARIVDIETYDDAGTIRYVAILVSNTGADAKAWWWYGNQTSTQVVANVNANGGRLTSFDRYSTGGVDRFTTVMISNTGADQRSWSYFFGASAASIGQNVQQQGNRVYGLERVGTDSYDVILIAGLGFGWWQYYDQTSAQVTEALQQNLARIVDIERHFTLSGTRYNVVMVDNANSLERTARQAFYTAPAPSLGDHGFWLKEINGPVLAQMRPDTVFEPASTMKTVYHAYAMRRVHMGLSSLGTQINKPTSCGVPGSNQSVQTTLRQMMQWSDNYSTLAISNHYGIANINSMADSIGMASTNINYTIGCEGPLPESQLTLRDIATLHETVANGYLGSQRQTFYDLMANGPVDGLPFPTWGNDTLDARIDAEALVLGLPNAVRDAFKQELLLAYKPGGIGWTVPGPMTFYFAEAGYASVPFKNAAGVITPKEYTYGVFNYLFTGSANEFAGREAMCLAELELVWSRVKPALATWDNYVAGSIVALSGAGCAGSNGTPQHQTTGTPEIGQTVRYNLTNAPNGTIRLCMFGFDNVSWNGAPLPLNLAVVGASGCQLRINAVILDAGITTAFGTSHELVAFPNDTALIGQRLFSQYLVSDPAANAFGFTISNALRTTLGGWL
ncbi:MAG: class A beta-lactamase-related serine hydrolase [Planctomycetes bacterium]|jgi:hypothetical protein|nr:class A beta-lactamase-related serine hydrolase [Planctomycetota bacterium]